MCVIVFYKSPFFDTDTFILSQTPTTFRKTEISAVAVVTKCFGAGKACFAQLHACHVARVAKQAVRVFATVFNASHMPQIFGNGNIAVVLAALLRVKTPYNKKQAIRSELPALLLIYLSSGFIVGIFVSVLSFAEISCSNGH